MKRGGWRAEATGRCTGDIDVRNRWWRGDIDVRNRW